MPPQICIANPSDARAFRVAVRNDEFSINFSDSLWLKQFVGSLQGTGAMDQRTLLMIVWDEGSGPDTRSNRVLAMLLGPMVTQGRYSARLTHYSLLRTIEDNFGLLPVADGDATASPVPEEVWRASAP